MCVHIIKGFITFFSMNKQDLRLKLVNMKEKKSF